MVSPWMGVETLPPIGEERPVQLSPLGAVTEQEVTFCADQLTLVPRGLSGSETLVLKLLTADTPSHIDSLIDRSKLSISDLTAALLSLEMRELIRALPGRCFVRKM